MVGRGDHFLGCTGQQDRKATSQRSEVRGRVPVGTLAQPDEQDIVDQVRHVPRVKPMEKTRIDCRHRRDAFVLV